MGNSFAQGTTSHYDNKEDVNDLNIENRNEEEKLTDCCEPKDKLLFI